MTLTQEQADSYLKDGGIRCPFCRSDNIAGDELVVDQGVISQEMYCLECPGNWKDESVLTRLVINGSTEYHRPRNIQPRTWLRVSRAAHPNPRRGHD